ncbi:MAG: cation diffusion facilitator family transporter [Coriobacteriales bacterium]
MEEEFDRARKRTSGIRRVMLIVLAINLFIALSKIATGVIFNSSAVRADGIHSIFDAASNLIALAGIAIAGRPADEDHPYGHGKYEAFASMGIGVLLLMAAYEVGWNAIQELLSGQVDADASPVSFAVMVVTIVANIFCTTYERRMGEKYHSGILGTDAKHTLSDALVSGSVIVGLVFVAFGFPWADPIAALVVTVAIFAAAISVFKEVNDVFADEARIKPKLIAECVFEVPEVRACHLIRTRGLEGEVYVDLHILVDPEMTVLVAHQVADKVEQHVMDKYPQVKEVLVHIEPAVPEERAAADGVATIKNENGIEEFTRAV